jgi:hypothetical protein
MFHGVHLELFGGRHLPDPFSVIQGDLAGRLRFHSDLYISESQMIE